MVDQKKALLAGAEQSVKQLKAAYDQALANMEKINVQVNLAQTDYDRQVYLLEKKVVAQSVVDTATRNLDAAKQGLAAAQAAAESARLAYEVEIGGVNTTVARFQAALDDAQYDLDSNGRPSARSRLCDTNGVTPRNVHSPRSLTSRHGLHT